MLQRIFMGTILALFFLPLVFAGDSKEERPELVTDRPDLTESSSVVPKGTIQVEMGWSMEELSSPGEDLTAHHFPETLARIGLHDRIELRLGWDGGQWQDLRKDGTNVDSRGIGDMYLGTKISLWSEDGNLPETGLILGTSVPTGTKCRAAEQLANRRYCSSFNLYSSRRADPSVILAMAKTLNERLSIGWNVGTVWLTEREDDGDLDTFPRGIYSVALGISATERTGFFVEFFGDTALSGGSRPSNNFDGGITFLVLPNVQIDASVGKGISSESPDWFAGAGISFRLPG
jgi:Putative MetA-pathway of phenol degradation